MSRHTRFRTLLFASVLVLAAAPNPTSVASAAITDGKLAWWDGFGLPSVDGPVLCSARYRGGVVIGGRFSLVGDTPAQNLAWWTGRRWEALGAGSDGDVSCLFVAHDTLLVGGRFQHAGNVLSPGVARWTGGAWQAMGHGLDDAQLPSAGVSDLGTYRGALVAVGDFTRSGATAARHAALWDGVAWQPLGAGPDAPATALAVYRDRLYAACAVDSAGVPVGATLQAWDGAQWSAPGALFRSGGSPGSILALTTFQDRLIAGGSFDRVGDVAASAIAAWDGTAWSPLGSTVWGAVTALASRGDSLYVAALPGTPLLIWDGKGWLWPAFNITGFSATSLVADASGFVATGSIHAQDPLTGRATGFSVLAGTDQAWQALQTWTDRMRGLGPDAQVSALASYRSGVVAAGSFGWAGEPNGWTELDGLGRWDGTRWEAFPGWPPYPYGNPRALLARGDTLYVGGAFYEYRGQARVNVPAYRYDGAQWTVLDTLSLDATSFTVYHGDLYMAGWRRSLSDPRSGGVYRWDATHWTQVAAADNDTDFPGILALQLFGDRLVAGGFFTQIAGVPATNVAAWDGAQWQPLGSTLSNAGDVAAVDGLAVVNDTLYATGQFDAPNPAVVRWDGVQWQPVGALRGLGSRLGAWNGSLYAAGGFRTDSGSYISLEAWDGQDWTPVGAGVNGGAQALLADAGHLYVGGRFTRAGDVPSFGIARLDTIEANVPTQFALPSFGMPNPFRGTIDFSYRLASAGPVVVTAHDAAGRLLATLAAGERPAGVSHVQWNGRAANGRALSAGLYFIRFSFPGGRVATRKAVLLP